jgi:hypothetical protein
MGGEYVRGEGDWYRCRFHPRSRKGRLPESGETAKLGGMIRSKAAGLNVAPRLIALGLFLGCSGEGITADEPVAVAGGRAGGVAAAGGAVSAGGAGGAGGRAGQGNVSSMGGSATGMGGSDVSNAGTSAGVGGSMRPISEPVCDAMRTVLQARCGNNSCHSNPRATIGDFAVGMEQAEAYIDRPSVRDPACGLIIDSANPSESLLLRKLTGDFPVPACGAFMPVTGDSLTDAQIDCMENWLQQFQR